MKNARKRRVRYSQRFQRRFLLFGSHRRGAAAASERIHIGSEVAAQAINSATEPKKAWHGGEASPLESN